MIKLISAGEIVAGLYVAAFEWLETKFVPNTFTGAVEEIQVKSNSPWIKGIPYKVVGRAGNMIAVDTFNTAPGINRIIMFDLTKVKFFEVEKDYHDSYYRGFGVREELLNPPAPIVKQTQVSQPPIG